LAHYNPTKGVYSNEVEQTVNSPVEMWVEAVDVILDKMKQDDFPFERVAVISGAGQVPNLFSASSFKSNMHLSSGRLRPSVFSRN
jgi:sugar (pentulose or hexulose) kinase